jgi:hypothetical protein
MLFEGGLHNGDLFPKKSEAHFLSVLWAQSKAGLAMSPLPEDIYSILGYSALRNWDKWRPHHGPLSFRDHILVSNACLLRTFLKPVPGRFPHVAGHPLSS